MSGVGGVTDADFCWSPEQAGIKGDQDNLHSPEPSSSCYNREDSKAKTTLIWVKVLKVEFYGTGQKSA